MDTQIQGRRNYGFGFGLVTGTFVGAGLAILFAPRIAALQDQLTESARNLGESARSLGHQATVRVGETVDDLTRRGQNVGDNVADVVARGAHEVERFATAAKSGRS